jgi:hypothetical protein
MTFEVPGPAVVGAPPLDSRARQIFAYFKRYNYQVKETGEVITFEGVYAADRGQAAAVTFYTFAGEGRDVMRTAATAAGGCMNRARANDASSHASAAAATLYASAG